MTRHTKEESESLGNVMKPFLIEDETVSQVPCFACKQPLCKYSYKHLWLTQIQYNYAFSGDL